MPLDITFTLSDSDLERFQAIIDKARDSVKDEPTAQEVERAARELIAETQEGDLPEFIASRMIKLNIMINMVNDEEWRLSDADRRRVLSALAYLCDPEDLIPDHIPGLGFLDDAIYAEIVINEMRPEIELYKEFCAFRKTEETRRAARGEDIKVGREEWLAGKRSALHANLRKRRSGGKDRGNWRLRFF